MKDNEHLSEETNLLYSSRKMTQRNDSKASIGSVKNESKQAINESEEVSNQPTVKTKFFADKISLKMPGSLPENSIYKVMHQKSNSTSHLMSKKHSEAGLRNEPEQGMKKKLHPDASPKIKLKKNSVQKMTKVMSEEKKINYNIDVKLNINLKIQERLNKGPDGSSVPGEEGRLPEIKNNKLLKYRLNNKYPGAGLNTIYNSYGNLSIMGETKEISKGLKKP